MFNVQVHTDKESEEGQSSVKLTWRQGQPPPKEMSQFLGTAVVHGSSAYFSRRTGRVYSYTVSGDKWKKLPKCKYQQFGLAVVKEKLTTIGGNIRGELGSTNSLFSLSGSSWKEVFPPMPTERCHVAAASTPTHLVVAGGQKRFFSEFLATVEVLSQETLKWSTARSLPRDVTRLFPQLTLCRGSFYLSHCNDLYSCSVEDLLESCKPATNSSDGGCVWTELAAIPVSQYSNLVTLRGCVLAIGGEDGNRTGAIHCYNVATNSWSVISEMPTPRIHALAAVLPSNDLVVVGGKFTPRKDCHATDIGNYI